MLMPMGIVVDVCGAGYMMILEARNGEYRGKINMTVGTPVYITSSHHAKVFTVSYNLGSHRRTALFEMECCLDDLEDTVNVFLDELRKYSGIVPVIRKDELWCPDKKDKKITLSSLVQSAVI